jgi:replication factor C subunit 3/5
LFKVVVINDVDALSRDAQHALRRTMEKYVASCRIVLCSSSACRVLEPIRSRCLAIRVPAPQEQEIADVLQAVAKRENFSVPDELALRLAKSSERNLRKAILSLEATRMRALVAGSKVSLAADTPVVRTDWEEYIAAIAGQITREQTPTALLRVRERLYELLSHCIPAPLILRTLVLSLISKCDDSVRIPAVRWAAEYDHRLRLGTKDIFHLEAFVAQFMALYRRFLQSAVGDISTW